MLRQLKLRGPQRAERIAAFPEREQENNINDEAGESDHSAQLRRKQPGSKTSEASQCNKQPVCFESIAVQFDIVHGLHFLDAADKLIKNEDTIGKGNSGQQRTHGTKSIRDAKQIKTVQRERIEDHEDDIQIQFFVPGTVKPHFLESYGQEHVTNRGRQQPDRDRLAELNVEIQQNKDAAQKKLKHAFFLLLKSQTE